jgi:hypothetical protein
VPGGAVVVGRFVVERLLPGGLPAVRGVAGEFSGAGDAGGHASGERGAPHSGVCPVVGAFLRAALFEDQQSGQVGQVAVVRLVVMLASLVVGERG